MTEALDTLIDDPQTEEQVDPLEPERLDAITYRLVAMGFVLLTLVIITGAAWAQYAWHRWWSWDPKETSALVAWLVYVVYLHGRLLGWSKKTTAWIAVLGTVAVLFCYAGINFVDVESVHVYGAPVGGLLESAKTSFTGIEGTESVLTKGFLLCYLLAFMGYLAGTAFRGVASSKVLLLGLLPVIVGFGFHTAALTLRSVEGHRLPFSSGYEYATSFAWAMILVFMVMQWRLKTPVIGVWSMPLVALILGYGFLGFQDKSVTELPPALQSMFWLHLHVAIAIISYATLLLATATAGLYLWKSRGKHEERESDEE